MRFYSLLRLLTFIAMIGTVFFAAIFYMGSPEQLNETLAEGGWKFFSVRLVFCLVAASPFCLLDSLLQYVYRKSVPFRWRRVVVSVSACVVSAVVMTAIFWYKVL